MSQVVADDLPSRAAENVANKEDLHESRIFDTNTTAGAASAHGAATNGASR
jgi:hypothetical protein